MRRSNWLLTLFGLVGVGLAACNSSEATASADTAGPPSSPTHAPSPSTVSGDPLWRLMLEYGTLAAVNRAPTTEMPTAPIEADLWIISDMSGASDTMQIALTVDCQARTYATRNIATYAGANLVADDPAQDAAAHPANPDTPYSALMAHVCEVHPVASPEPDYADFTQAQAALRAAVI